MSTECGQCCLTHRLVCLFIFFCSLVRKWNLGLGMRLEPRNKARQVKTGLGYSHSVGLRYSGVWE